MFGGGVREFFMSEMIQNEFTDLIKHKLNAFLFVMLSVNARNFDNSNLNSPVLEDLQTYLAKGKKLSISYEDYYIISNDQDLLSIDIRINDEYNQEWFNGKVSFDRLKKEPVALALTSSIISNDNVLILQPTSVNDLESTLESILKQTDSLVFQIGQISQVGATKKILGYILSPAS